MRKPAKHTWLQNLADHLDTSGQKVYQAAELTRLLLDQQAKNRIPRSLTPIAVIGALKSSSKLQSITMSREGDVTKNPKKLLAWGEPSGFQLGAALSRGAYFSHETALFLNGLTTTDEPATLYINKEQSPKPSPSGGLAQDSINRAFRNRPRVSQYVFLWKEIRFVLLSGKNTNDLQVSDVPTSGKELAPTTGLERTLIDVVVRPAYAGGLTQVLNAYTKALPRISVTKLLTTLRKLNHVYPYQQSIGFLMEKAGYPEKDLARIEKLRTDFDFYLDYQMRRPLYSPRWKLYYPRGI